MEFRDFDGRKVQRPSLDVEDLTALDAAFRGEFAVELAEVDGGDQEEVSGEGEVSKSRLAGVVLRGATLEPLELRDSVLNGVDLSQAKLPKTTVQRVELLNCRAAGVQLGFEQASDFYAEGCQFDYGIIRIDRMKNPAAFSGCSFREAVLVGDLSNTVFLDCVFAGAEFEVTNAKGCDLRGSTFEDVKGFLSLRGARISSDQALSVALTIASESGLVVRD